MRKYFILSSLVALLAIAAIPAAAHADEGWHRGWRGHEWREHYRWHDHEGWRWNHWHPAGYMGSYYYGAPTYYYPGTAYYVAPPPPPVYVAPRPVYLEPMPAFSFFFGR